MTFWLIFCWFCPITSPTVYHTNGPQRSVPFLGWTQKIFRFFLANFCGFLQFLLQLSVETITAKLLMWVWCAVIFRKDPLSVILATYCATVHVSHGIFSIVIEVKKGRKSLSRSNRKACNNKLKNSPDICCSPVSYLSRHIFEGGPDRLCTIL